MMVEIENSNSKGQKRCILFGGSVKTSTERVTQYFKNDNW